MNAALADLVEEIGAVAMDLALGRARAWKAANRGPVIGWLPVHAPCELVHAQGGLPVAVLGGDVEIIRGDAYYQSYICHLPRSTIELALDGHLDVLDGMIFPATCDVIRNLSGVWQLDFPDRLSFYLDVPQNFDPAVGGRYYRRELEELSRRLVERGARPYAPEALERSIAQYDALRQAVRDAYELRRAEPWKAPTAELYLVLRASLVAPVEDAIRWVRAYTELAAADTARRAMDQARVVLVGPFCEQPPLGLIRTLERSGCYIVDDDLFPALRMFRRDVARAGDPLDQLVEAYLADVCESPVRYAGTTPRGGELVARVRASGAAGVLFGAPSFCDPALLDQPMAVRALDQAGIPWTAFKYAENNGQFQVIREQAGTFADSIKLWGEG